MQVKAIIKRLNSFINDEKVPGLDSIFSSAFTVTAFKQLSACRLTFF